MWKFLSSYSNINCNAISDFFLMEWKLQHSIYCRNVFKTKSNFCDRAFLRKQLMTKSRWLIFQKSSIIDVWLGSKYICLCITTLLSTILHIICYLDIHSHLCMVFARSLFLLSWVILMEASVIIIFQDQLIKKMAQNRQNPDIIIVTISTKRWNSITQ